MFSFDVQTNNTYDYTLDNPAIEAVSNPILLLPGPTTSGSTWNVALLMEYGQEVLFCMFSE
jgi:hypothetical protein